MVDVPGAVGEAVVSKARDWKEPIGRLGLVGQGVLATIIGLLAIRIAMGDKDEAATSAGAAAGSGSTRPGTTCRATGR